MAARAGEEEEEHEGASVQEVLIEACRGNNPDLLLECLASRPEAEIARLLNETTTVMGNHLYHEAASRGNYEVIDLLLDQTDFECDPVNRLEGDTPLHSAIRWLNGEPLAQRPFGQALIQMMLEAGSNPAMRNRGGLTPVQLVDPSNRDLRQLINQHQYAVQNAGDFVVPDHLPASDSRPGPAAASAPSAGSRPEPFDADFSGSDDDDRAEWERRRKAKPA